MKDGSNGYFEAALSDFMFDVAAGGAIRHLADRGYSIEQIVKELDYPVPRAKVEKAFQRHLSESGVLLWKLPEQYEEWKVKLTRAAEKDALSVTLISYIQKYGEKNSYVECRFGQWSKQDEQKMQQVMAFLSSREREYLSSIRWEQSVMYHRLTGRMREIAIKLAAQVQEEWKFYFFP